MKAQGLGPGRETTRLRGRGRMLEHETHKGFVGLDVRWSVKIRGPGKLEDPVTLQS